MSTSPLEILLVDDDASIRKHLGSMLSSRGHFIRTAANGSAALREWRSRRPDLMLLDVMMPGMDGYAVCQKIRQADAVLPIVFLTALDGEADELRGLSSGGDDFVRKSASPTLLTARIEAVIRRRRGVSSGEPFGLGAANVDPQEMNLRCAGKRLPLSPREVEMLRYFAAHPGETLVKDDLLARFWADGEADESVLFVQISRLREKLAGCGVGIRSRRGVGYGLFPDHRPA